MMKRAEYEQLAMAHGRGAALAQADQHGDAWLREPEEVIVAQASVASDVAAEQLYRADDPARRLGPAGRTGYREIFARHYRQEWQTRRAKLPEVRAELAEKSFYYRLDNMDRDARATLEKFQADLAKDPAYALSWGERAVEAGAKLQVATKAKARCAEVPFAKVLQILTRERNQKARWPASSTSQVSNVFEHYVLGAYADLCEAGTWGTDE